LFALNATSVDILIKRGETSINSTLLQSSNMPVAYYVRDVMGYPREGIIDTFSIGTASTSNTVKIKRGLEGKLELLMLKPLGHDQQNLKTAESSAGL